MGLIVLNGCNSDYHCCKDYWVVHSNISIGQGEHYRVTDDSCYIEKGFGGGIAYHKADIETVRNWCKLQ